MPLKTAVSIAAFTGLLVVSPQVLASGPRSQDVTLHSSDNVSVYGTYYRPTGNARALILLFHQAGSNRGEYAPIVPRLTALGFDVLAIDQRAGGAMWARQNQTVAKQGQGAAYKTALQDLEASLQWGRARNQSEPVIAWGSSYSAALIFLLAAKHPGEVTALMAFSPGEYLDDADEVHTAAAQVSVPLFVTSAKDDAEIERARSILAASPAAQKIQFVPTISGVHGSSTLREDQNPDGAAENWTAVKAFLASLKFQ